MIKKWRIGTEKRQIFLTSSPTEKFYMSSDSKKNSYKRSVNISLDLPWTGFEDNVKNVTGRSEEFWEKCFYQKW